MLTLTTQRATIKQAKGDAVATVVFEDKKLLKAQTRHLAEIFPDLAHLLSTMSFLGKEKEAIVLFPKAIPSNRLILIGVGQSEKLSMERLRKAAAVCVKTSTTLKIQSVALMEPDPDIIGDSPLAGSSSNEIAFALGEGALLSNYRFDKYITVDRQESRLKSFSILSSDPDRVKQIRAGLDRAGIVCEGTCLARDLSNEPANDLFPETLAARAIRAGKSSGFKVTVLDERKIRALRMGGLLGVSQGSARPPRFIIMEYNTSRKSLPLVILVGKGVTFDAGGISIKPAQGMGEMKMDMSGAAAVVGTMQAASRLALPLRLIGLIPATENLLGGAAMKPGDILVHYNGKTSEVDNTDAEGRLILADALSYATRYKPDLVIDLATLTGACVVALGQEASGMMGNDQGMMDRLKTAGERSYERVWQLPMFEEYEKLIKSDVADVKNVGGKWAGAITAALFLKKFIGDYKWIHLDIAGTAILEEAGDYAAKGGSGVGVRLLTEFLSRWNQP